MDALVAGDAALVTGAGLDLFDWFAPPDLGFELEPGAKV
jgi:hypothetical protein